MIKNETLSNWIFDMAKLCQPKDIYWCNGSDIEYQTLIDQLVKEKKAVKLNTEKRPNSYAFFSDPSDVARVEDRTFIASIKESDSGPTNNWYEPKALKEKMTELYSGSMVGRTMYVIPFIMGPVGAKIAQIGVQITDSPYVVLNMRLMTRMGSKILRMIEDGAPFVPCMHSVGYPLNNRPDIDWPSAPIEEKYIAHFPEERLIWSYGSGYGGNALLGKKCLALRIASKIAQAEHWMAEHMLILKITNPEGSSKFILGAFPSACGKTNLAMLVPTIPGWKVETVGDDIAWIFKKKDGKFYAINPEKGFFGVAKGTSYQTNPNAMKSIEKNTIFTNVALTEDLDVWWEGMGETPDKLISWKKEVWHKGDTTPAAHPNSRFTVAIEQAPNLAKEYDDPEGVPISAILVGGRRATTIPLVTESYDYNHGIFMGSMMGSEITAAAISNDIGKVRRDPFAMLPFIGYHVADYLSHWFTMKEGSKSANLPKFYYVNWFKKDEKGNFMWPGYGDNSRVLKWIFERAEGKAKGIETPIGIMPDLNDFDTKGLSIELDTLKRLFEVDRDAWKQEMIDLKAYYHSLGEKMPKALYDELEKQIARLNA
ncbi:phosphoenolpyruvate carboxykinase (GTP) [Acholeplasma vituli]|uniref:Phosphoenolpyruvate carboxykinase [GTP] n=1 Tax=Paracholeplasma vituli TaxID=69473 RepID=A0ABT2PXL2_9MOLU|nr:phosphoenolpyruvate carboxykinase (GTP) [Paracholeplasma vituli]MCU0105700.1 phosphoenolpyruvate carboxykinase (GTP) [Paracholeplasma vituli]